MKNIDPNTDYKALFNSTCLNEADFPEPETVVKIRAVGSIPSVDGKGPDMTVVSLEGYQKPMKMCNEMMDNMYSMTGDRKVGSWIGKSITVYILFGLRAFGSIHNVPRIRKQAPRIAAEIPFLSQDQYNIIASKMDAKEQAQYCKNNKIEAMNHCRQDMAVKLIKFLNKPVKKTEEGK